MADLSSISFCGRFFLAPMAGVTDYAFRKICRELGAAFTVTEMVSAKALVYGDEKTVSLLYIPSEEHPSAVQIFGHEPDVMAEAAVRALELSGADVLDINMGCPVGKIVKSGDGSALMLQPDLAEKILRSVVNAVKVPVTVKFRKGFDNGHVNAVEFARIAEAAGVSAVAIHGRTRVQMYSGRADWDIIRSVKAAIQIPVIANGDVFSPEDAVHILRYTGADFAMIGRGTFGNPWLFRQANASFAGEPVPELPSLSERMDTAVRQIELLAVQRGERSACLEARHQLAWYLHGVPHAAYYRQKLVQVATLEDIYAVVRGIKRDLC
ncbi:MAG: tRNA dihydrouridine synthase DusB [Oscillospiraceae bacterium]|nr:tRNA dihydrouridine synthase DusB [Oscillospiraceae bacterium]